MPDVGGRPRGFRCEWEWSSAGCVRSRLVDDELAALQWLTVDELAAERRRAIKRLNLLDHSAAGFWRPKLRFSARWR